jgi:uncharacterized protein YxjI
MSDKALVIRDDKGKFKDVGDVLAIARAEGKKLFKTHENVSVVRLFFDVEVGWIAVVRCPLAVAGCSSSADVSRGEKNRK